MSDIIKTILFEKNIGELKFLSKDIQRIYQNNKVVWDKMKNDKEREGKTE